MTGPARARRPGERPAAFLAPAVVVLAAVTALPILHVSALSLARYTLLGEGPAWAGLANYRRLLADARFWNALGNTAYFTVASVALELALGLAVALLLHRPLPARGLLRAVVLIPWALPVTVSARMWEWMLEVDHGVVNALLGARVNWLGSPAWAIHVAIATDVWKMTPFVALLLLAGLQAIPPELERAARVDGASAWTIFRRVTLPLLAPLLLMVVVFRTIDALRVFDAIYVLTGGGPGNSTETLSIYAYKILFQTLDLGYGAALAVAMFLLAGGVTAVYARLLRARLA
jgi:multiple sugar transport system permease protein